jgi:Transglycosylase
MRLKLLQGSLPLSERGPQAQESAGNRAVRRVLGFATVASDTAFGPGCEAAAHRLARELRLPAHFLIQLFAVEDKRFAHHIGVDPVSILRATVFNLGVRPRRLHGASTLTQQLYSDAQRRKRRYKPTLRFKVAQSIWAICQTATRSKPAILRDYLSSVYFGRGYRGLRSAALGYCRQVPSDLTVDASFFLVERIGRPNAISSLRVEALARRQPIARLLRTDTRSVERLTDLYDRHFHCGKVIAQCLERALKRSAEPMSTSLVGVLRGHLIRPSGELLMSTRAPRS